MSDFREVPFIVKPRKVTYESRKLLVVTQDVVWLESDSGEVFPRERLPFIIAKTPSTILVTENAAAILKELEAYFSDWDEWAWRVTPVERRTYRQHTKTNRPTITRDAVVNYFGFRHVQENGRVRTNYHYPIDTLTFLSGSNGRGFGTGDQLRDLIKWGQDVREFCRENGLKISPTSGGLAAQLLRDARFFPEPRRKVPRATNDRARQHLPGNHYELFVPENTTQMNALYLDMKGAHHYAASLVTFPDPNRMYARGRWRNPPETVTGEPWARAGTRKFRRIIETHGLFLIRHTVPAQLKATTDQFPPPWLRRSEKTAISYVYSNELPLFEKYGAVIEGVEAAWTSGNSNNGLNGYAEWAITETAKMTDDRKAWAKPTLLAAYGLLAARPSAREFGHRHSDKGEDRVYMTFGGPHQVKAIRTSREIETPIANVILRGMIEAQVRLEVLSLATDLHSRGISVLALYADSVIVGTEATLPLLPAPWIVKTEMTRLTFFNPVSFVSDEMERLPGISREGVDRLRVRQMNAAAGASVRENPRHDRYPRHLWSSNQLDIIDSTPESREAARLRLVKSLDS